MLSTRTKLYLSFALFVGALGVTTAALAVPPATKPGDCNGDGAVDLIDLQAVIGNFGRIVPPCLFGDCNGDGVVNLLDLALVIGNFGTC